MDTLVKDQTLRTKKLMIKEMTCEFQEKEDVCDLLADRLRGLEQECSNLIQEKKELQDSLAEATLYEKELNQQTTIIQGSIVTCKSKADSQKRVTQEIIEETLPIQAEL